MRELKEVWKEIEELKKEYQILDNAKNTEEGEWKRFHDIDFDMQKLIEEKEQIEEIINIEDEKYLTKHEKYEKKVIKNCKGLYRL
jgi:hypothetical protein